MGGETYSRGGVTLPVENTRTFIEKDLSGSSLSEKKVEAEANASQEVTKTIRIGLG